MPDCRLIVCEKSSRWAAALRGAVGAERPRVVETRSIPGCEEALAESPAALVAVETTVTNLPSVVEFIAHLNERFPRAKVVALLAEEVAGAGALLREAGAIDAVCSVIETPRVASLAQRQLQQQPRRESEPSEFVADCMPWPSAATPTAKNHHEH
jgi:hypothetical protein